MLGPRVPQLPGHARRGMSGRGARTAAHDRHAVADVEGLRELYPDKPVVLTASGIELDWVETEGPHRVVPLVGIPTGDRLVEAIDRATGETTTQAS